MDLKSFLKQNAIQNEIVKYVVSDRFLDDKKNPIEWQIRAITSKEDEEIRRTATRKVATSGKRGQFIQEMDANKYVGLLATACTVEPNLNDAALQDSYGVMSADDLLKTMLLPGEYADYLVKVQEVCGFDKSEQNLIDEAKN